MLIREIRGSNLLEWTLKLKIIEPGQVDYGQINTERRSLQSLIFLALMKYSLLIR